MLGDHVVIFNKSRKYSLRNAYEVIHKYVSEPNSIIISLDGDDWLTRDDVLDVLDEVYSNKNCNLTYGNCILFNPQHQNHNLLASTENPHANTRYSPETEKNNSYRTEFFRPLHLKTWRADLFKKIKKQEFLRPDGSWIKFCEDQAILFPLLEMSAGKYEVIEDHLSAYNLNTNLSDGKLYPKERLFDEVNLRRKNFKFKFNPQKRACEINHFFLLDLPWIGGIFQLLILILVYLNFTSKVYLSRNKKTSTKIALKFIKNKFGQAKCNTYKLGRVIKDADFPIFSDQIFSNSNLNQIDYGELMWTLVSSSSLSADTIKLLSNSYHQGFSQIFT